MTVMSIAMYRMDEKCPCLMPLLLRRDAEPPFLFAYLHLVKTRLLQTCL